MKYLHTSFLLLALCLLAGCWNTETFTGDLKVEGREGRWIRNGQHLATLLDGTDFGSAAVWSAHAPEEWVERSFIIKNQRSSSIRLVNGDGDENQAQFVGGNSEDFQLLSYFPESLESGQSVELRIRFLPNNIGQRTTVVNFFYDTGNGVQRPYSFRIVGQALGRGQIALFNASGTEVIEPASDQISETLGTDFGVVDIQAARPSERSFRIRNQAQRGRLHLSNIDLHGPYRNDFSIVSNSSGMTLEPGEEALLRLRFAPGSGAEVRRQAEVLIRSSDLRLENYSFLVEGRVSAGMIALTNEAGSADIANQSRQINDTLGTDFGEVEADLSSFSSRAFRIVNRCEEVPLRLSHVRLEEMEARDFEVVSNLPESLPPGGETLIVIRFNPRDLYDVHSLRQTWVSVRSSDLEQQPDFRFLIEGIAIPASDG